MLILSKVIVNRLDKFFSLNFGVTKVMTIYEGRCKKVVSNFELIKTFATYTFEGKGLLLNINSHKTKNNRII